jgi:predicted DNA-binding WGR domain protein
MVASEDKTMMALLVRIEPEKNMNRWYSVCVQRTLLDPVAVVCAWGNRRTNYLRTRVLPAGSLEEATELADDIVNRKIRRGYRVSIKQRLIN